MALNSSKSNATRRTKSSAPLIPCLLNAVRIMNPLSTLIRNVEQLPGTRNQEASSVDLKSKVQDEAR